jgi:hypothetical protein
MGPIVQHMTPLAEAFEVDQPIVRGIMIKMRGGEHNASAAAARRFQQIWPTRGTPALVAPSACFIIKPAAVRQATDLLHMWSATTLATTSGTLEPHVSTQLAPMRGIERP